MHDVDIAMVIARSDGHKDWSRLSHSVRQIYLHNAMALSGALDLAPGHPEPPRHWRITMTYGEEAWTVHVDKGPDGSAWIESDDDPIRALMEEIAEEDTP